MTPERRREIASLGGQSAHAQGRAHQFDTAEARVAGAKGREIRGYRAGAAPLTAQDRAERRAAAARDAEIHRDALEVQEDLLG